MKNAIIRRAALSIMAAALAFAAVDQARAEPERASWLCIAEEAVFVNVGDGSSILDSGTIQVPNNYKYLLDSEKGLRKFGSDNKYLDECWTGEDGRPTLCEKSGIGWAGTFTLNNHNIFSLWTMGSWDAESHIYNAIIVGRCSEL